jgi:hypothetical protein
MVSKLGDTRPVSSLLNMALLMLARPATSASVRFWLSRSRRAVRPKSTAGLSARSADGLTVIGGLPARPAALPWGRCDLRIIGGIAQYAN